MKTQTSKCKHFCQSTLLRKKCRVGSQVVKQGPSRWIVEVNTDFCARSSQMQLGAALESAGACTLCEPVGCTYVSKLCGCTARASHTKQTSCSTINCTVISIPPRLWSAVLTRHTLFHGLSWRFFGCTNEFKKNPNWCFYVICTVTTKSENELLTFYCVCVVISDDSPNTIPIPDLCFTRRKMTRCRSQSHLRIVHTTARTTRARRLIPSVKFSKVLQS